jgi:quercetin dioxygenase-like cupin family protein
MDVLAHNCKHCDMAIITLQPGESFAHRHDTDSYTVLLDGDAELETDSGTALLIHGERVLTPAGEYHAVIAKSNGVVFECTHSPASA